MSDIAFGPSRAVNDIRRRAQQLIIYGRRRCENVARWMTTLSPEAFLPNSRRRMQDYEIARRNIAPEERATEALRRSQGRYRRRRNQILQEIYL